MGKLIGILLVAGVILGAAYYFFIYLPSQGTPEDGSCTDGTIINGVCVASSSTTVPTVPKPASVEVTNPFRAGDDVYLNPLATSPATQNGIPVYKAPIADSAGTYLLGVVRPEWYFPSSIGKFASKVNDGWSKVSVNNLQLYGYAGGYTTSVIKVTQDVFFSTTAIQKTPY